MSRFAFVVGIICVGLTVSPTSANGTPEKSPTLKLNLGTGSSESLPYKKIKGTISITRRYTGGSKEQKKATPPVAGIKKPSLTGTKEPSATTPNHQTPEPHPKKPSATKAEDQTPEQHPKKPSATTPEYQTPEPHPKKPKEPKESKADSEIKELISNLIGKPAKKIYIYTKEPFNTLTKSFFINDLKILDPKMFPLFGYLVVFSTKVNLNHPLTSEEAMQFYSQKFCAVLVETKGKNKELLPITPSPNIEEVIAKYKLPASAKLFQYGKMFCMPYLLYAIYEADKKWNSSVLIHLPG